MDTILIVIAVVSALAGLFLYNPMRRKMAGIVGVGGAYMILIGLMCTVLFAGQLLSGGIGSTVPVSEWVMMLIFAVGCLGYMVYVMLTRCHTTAQKVMLPIASMLIAFGFCYRLVWMLITHAPMSAPEAPETVFPESIMSPDGEHFQREWAAGDHAAYWCARTGDRVQFHTADFDLGYPNGWYEA